MRNDVRAFADVVPGLQPGQRDRVRRLSSLRAVTVEELRSQLDADDGPTPLDVRFGYEWRLGHVPDALNIEMGQLPERAGSLSRERSYATLCAAGVRNSTAASILERGFRRCRAGPGRHRRLARGRLSSRKTLTLSLGVGRKMPPG